MRSAWSRRTFIGGAGASLAGLTLSHWPRPAAAAISRTELTPDLSLLTGTGGNLLALATGAGRILVDSGTAGETSDLASLLDQQSDDPVVAVFNTHWHPEQVGGNAAFGSAGAVIHAHVKTQQRLANGYYLPVDERYQPPLPAAGVPTASFYEDASFRFGGSAVECAYLIGAHTDGDIAVMLPDANVIAIGGVISPLRDPEFDWFGGGWLGGRLDAYEWLLEHSDAATRFVPALGPVISQAELRAEYDRLLVLFDRMVEHVRLGETPRDMLEAGVLDGLGRNFADPDRLIYDLNKGFWAHQNKLMHDIV
jgi:glyoxylase-like metal-dependent hydrolase (beta-lactamase superfamily II)